MKRTTCLLALLASLIVVSPLAAPVAAQTPGIRIGWDYRTITEVFGGNASYPRMTRLSSGELLVAYIDYAGKTDIHVRRSSDGGRTWSTPVVGAVDHRNGVTTNNPELIELEDGTVLLAYGIRPGGNPDAHLALRVNRSTDGGRTWTEGPTVYEAAKTPKGGVWEPMIIQLPSGELQLFAANEFPYWQAGNNDQEISMWRSWDDGETWTDEFETVAYRQGWRDGMPVAVVLKEDKGIAFVIESNGWSDECWRLKPTIIWTPSVEDAWFNAPVLHGDDEHRWHALAPEHRMNCATKASAPYLVQFPQGETVISFHTDEGRSSKEQLMMVAVGSDEAKNFHSKTTPLAIPDAEGEHAKWGSIAIKDSNTVAAVLNTSMFNGPNRGGGFKQVYTIDGYRIPEPRVRYSDEIVVDGRLDEASWKDAHTTFIGARSETNATFHPLWDEEHLYLACRVSDDDLWVDSEVGERQDDACVFDFYRLGWGSYRVVADADGRLLTQRRSSDTWQPWSPAGVEVAVDVHGELNDTGSNDERYTIEVSLPWSEVAGQPPVGRGWGISYSLQDDRSGQERELIEYVGGNDPGDYTTWQRIELVEETSTAVDDVAAVRETRLRSAYPNPFSERVVIPLELKQSGAVEVTVYDLLGRRVTTLASGHRAAGRHELTWDGTGTDGLDVSAGVYLCRMTGGGRTTQTTRLVHVRR